MDTARPPSAPSSQKKRNPPNVVELQQTITTRNLLSGCNFFYCEFLYYTVTLLHAVAYNALSFELGQQRSPRRQLIIFDTGTPDSLTSSSTANDMFSPLEQYVVHTRPINNCYNAAKSKHLYE